MPQSSAQFDIVVVGAGLVGAAFALALRDSGLRVAVVEPSPPASETDAWDGRIYALNPANVEFLSRLGVWPDLDPGRIQAVDRMEIYGDEGAHLEFCAYDAGVLALAYILESGRLQNALWRGLQRAPNVELIVGARCAAADFGQSEARLGLDDGRTLRAALLVGADGANSWVRQAAGLHADVYRYETQGVVANFECERSHDGVAFQWFRTDGVLAYLPLPGRRMSMVWSTPNAHAEELLRLPPEQLAARVAEAGQGVLGRLQVITPPQAFPLRKIRVPDIVAPGVALIGDAAHVVHPLAGQGVNLGFGDAMVLARLIAEREPYRGCGDPVLLRRYRRERAEPVAAMRLVTHGLERLFATRSRWLRTLRNRGLALTDRVVPVKNLLIRHAIG